jgi:dUTPase
VVLTKTKEMSIFPRRGTEGSAGFDLFNVTDTTIKPNDNAVIETGMRVQFPMGTNGRIAPRSGLAVKELIGVGGTTACTPKYITSRVDSLIHHHKFSAGVIDPDFEGTIKVV